MQQPESGRAKKKVVLTAEEFIPRRFGLNFNPPMIILEYMLRSRGKLYLKKMKLFKLRPTTSSDVALKYLKMRYPDFFSTNKIADPQVINLVEKLKDKLRQMTMMKKPEVEGKENQSSVHPDIKRNNFLGGENKNGPLPETKPHPGQKEAITSLKDEKNKIDEMSESSEERDDFDFDEIEDFEDETDEK